MALPKKKKKIFLSFNSTVRRTLCTMICFVFPLFLLLLRGELEGEKKKIREFFYMVLHSRYITMFFYVLFYIDQFSTTE